MSLLTGSGQVVLTGGVGVIICMLLGFDWATSSYVGIALAFSSTVIVLKLLSDKGDLDKLYVKLSIGSLLLQDLIAIILLFIILLFCPFFYYSPLYTLSSTWISLFSSFIISSPSLFFH